MFHWTTCNMSRIYIRVLKVRIVLTTARIIIWNVRAVWKCEEKNWHFVIKRLCWPQNCTTGHFTSLIWLWNIQKCFCKVKKTIEFHSLVFFILYKFVVFLIPELVIATDIVAKAINFVTQKCNFLILSPVIIVGAKTPL